MTKNFYHTRLKVLHPDLNGGDHSRVPELQEIVRAWKYENTFCACGCGRKMSRTQLSRKPPSRFVGKHHGRLITAKAQRKPRKINLSGAVKTQRVLKRNTPGKKPLVRHAELLTAAISCEVNGKPSVRPAATLKPTNKPMKNKLKYLVAAIAAGLMLTSAFADVSLVTVSPTNAPVTYTPIPAAAIATPAAVATPQLLSSLLQNGIVQVNNPFTFNGQTYLVTTNAAGIYTFATSGPSGNASFTPPSTTAGVTAGWQNWWSANNPTNISFYSTNETVVHLGALYDNKQGTALLNISLKKYGWISSQPNLGVGAGVLQGNNGTQSGLAVAYGELTYRKPIGDVAVDGGVVGGYDLFNKSMLAGLRGGLTYRLNPHLELWSDLVLEREFSGSQTGFNTLAAGGIGYVF